VVRDCFYPIVKAALTKESWAVNHDPLERNVGASGYGNLVSVLNLWRSGFEIFETLVQSNSIFIL
jgi:hypothetical protein